MEGEEIEDPEMGVPKLDILFYLHVDPVTGRVKGITEGQTEMEIPFELTSNVHRAAPCSAAIRVVTNEELKKLGELLISNQGNIK